MQKERSLRTKRQIRKVKTKKWVFLSWPNMTLTKHGFKTKFGLNLREETVEKKRRKEGEKKKKRKRKRREEKMKGRSKVWNY